VLCSGRLAALISYAWSEDSSSHILLIPIISLYFGWLERKRIFASIGSSVISGLTTTLGGVILFLVAGSPRLHLLGNEPLSLSAFSILIIWTGVFLVCYGARALRAVPFPFLFLLLMIPIPDPALDKIVYLLQRGSTEVAYLIFKTLQVPVLRQGFVLSVPGVTIEVAKECSSIRSSMALVITCMLVAHLYLRTWWKVLLFVLLSVPLSVIKNGFRIATLTLLSVCVNPDFLSGNLHRRGGFVFFFLALLAMWPVFVVLEKSEHCIASRNTSSHG
jgi:exosortase